jgi:predicted RNase H-like HicB family nuclease
VAEPMRYDAYLELAEDGACLAQLLDLPGCFARGPDERSAVERLVAGIPAYFAWLRQHDDYTPEVAGPFAVEIREVQRVSTHAGRPRAAFFAPAAEPVSSEDLDWLLALLDWAYADLMAALQTLPEGRTHADAVTRDQLWLLSRLEPEPRPVTIEQLDGEPLVRLRQVWQAALHRLRTSTEDERQRILEHDGECWSLRQVLYRSILLVRERTPRTR